MTDPHHVAIAESQRSSVGILARLAGMMFLQYWPLGAWGVTVGTFIAANTGDQGERIFSAGFIGYSTVAGSLGGMVAPVLIGYLSDRHWPAERLLCVMQLGCAAMGWGLYETRAEIPFFFWMLGYFHCFFPAAALTNKIALKHLVSPDREYPLLRVFGTAGWIGAGLFVGWLWPWLTEHSIESTRIPLALGALGSAIMAGYALTLPTTPAETAKGDRENDDRSRSLGLSQNRSLAMFLFVMLLACMPSMAYNNFANVFLNQQGYSRPAALMTLGQVSDLLCLIAAPWLTVRFGLRRLFLAGTLAWTTRYLLLAVGSQFHAAAAVYAAILIHGPCYVFIYVISVMYVDELADPDYRGSAQGLLAVASVGLGHLLGGTLAGVAQEQFLTPVDVSPPPFRWGLFWLAPAAASAVAAAFFAASFSGKSEAPRPSACDAKE